MKQNTKKAEMMYPVIQIGYWMDFAVISTFCTVYLTGIGFGPVQVGYITMIAAILSTILQPLLASVADRSLKVTLKQILTVCIAVCILCGTVLSLLRGAGAAAFVFAFVVISLTSSLQPILNAWCLQLNEAGIRINFGIARALGSLGYALGGYLMGVLTERFGAFIIFPGYCVIYLVIMILAWFMPSTQKKNAGTGKRSETPEQTRREAKSLPAFFRSYRRFDLLMAGAMLTIFMQILQNTYMIYFVRYFGGNEGDMGMVIFLMAASEIPVVALGIPLMKRLTAQRMLRCYAVFVFLQYALMLVVPNIQAFVFLHLIHLFSTGFYQVPAVYYANAVVQREDMVKAQAIIGAMTNGVMAVLANVLGGYMLENMDFRTIIIIGSGVTLAGSVLLFLATDRRVLKREPVRPIL